MLKYYIGALLVVGFAGSAFAAEALNDHDKEVALTLIEINEGEIDAAKIALDKATKPEVKSYAQMMLAEHEKNLAATKELTKAQAFGTKPSDLSKGIKQDSKVTAYNLEDTGQGGFDKSYIAFEVTAHQKALDTLKATLIPNAKNKELRAHLEKTRAAVAEHLNHAKKLQATL